MAKRPSSAAIGMFVIGAIVVGVSTIAVLGSGSLFKRPHKFICFFRGSLNGLNIGAPVKVRGVQIGSVAEIRLRLDPAEGRFKEGTGGFSALPVIVDIDESQLKARGGSGAALGPQELNAMLAHGLRAQLATESLLTGLLYVEVDLHPGSPLKLMLEPGTSQYLEIPTIPTDLQQVQEAALQALAKLDKVDVVKLTQSITDAGNAATNLMNSPDLRGTLTSLQTATANLNTTVKSINELVLQMRNNTDPLLVSLRKTSDQAGLTLAQMASVAAGLNSTLAPDAPLAYRLDLALDNFSEASSAIRELTDYLQRNPSALIRGKYVTQSHQ